jgi:TRAP-type C4-dicarboxylate transport system substrate-binding protein
MTSKWGKLNWGKSTWGFAVAAIVLCLTVAPSVRAEEIELTFATGAQPNQSPHPQVSLPWAERINEAGKGLVHIKVVQGFGVVTPQTFYERLKNDVVQIVYGLQGSVGGVFRLSDVVRIPYLAPNGEIGSVAFWRLYKSGLLDSDYKDVHPLALGMYPQAVLHLTKRPNSILNLAGLKIVANAKMTGDIIQKLGGTPISLLIQETYQGLQRRTVDGVITGYPVITVFKFNEVAPFHVDAELGGGATMLAMTKEKWNKLPPAVQKLLDENSGEALSRAYGVANDAEWVAGRKAAMAMKDQTIVVPTAAEHQAYQRELAPVADDWVKDNPDGAAVLAKFRELLSQAQAEVGQK